MNFALIGYGKMGRTIEAMGIQQGHSFPVIIDEDSTDLLRADHMKGIDAAIEFTVPAAAPGNIMECIRLGIPVVSGTTGWNDRISDIERFCMENKGTLFYASNFSVGVNILFAMNRKLAGIMKQFPEYAVSMEEVHHVHKKDAPSGTAISLAEQILEEKKQIKGWYLKGSDRDLEKAGDRLPIVAIREGEVKGKHSILYESELDSITLSHAAKTRDAFAAGALLAAAYIKDRKGVFGMQDLLNI
jgi:4-hydroxy-tetrahydrodipicolinate reductase